MSFPVVRPRRVARRVAGACWLAAWCAVLWAVAAPWRNLGGLESERLRWLEWWALCSGIALGYTMGLGARDWARSGVSRTHAVALRVALYPPGLVAAIALVALSFAGESGPIGVVATAFLSYWAGFDAAFCAVPLMEGRSYSLTRPLDPDDADVGTSWDRL